MRPEETVYTVLALIVGTTAAQDTQWASDEVREICEEEGVCCECGKSLHPDCLSIRCTKCRWDFATQPWPVSVRTRGA